MALPFVEINYVMLRPARILLLTPNPKKSTPDTASLQLIIRILHGLSILRNRNSQSLGHVGSCRICSIYRRAHLGLVLSGSVKEVSGCRVYMLLGARILGSGALGCRQCRNLGFQGLGLG